MLPEQYATHYQPLKGHSIIKSLEIQKTLNYKVKWWWSCQLKSQKIRSSTTTITINLIINILNRFRKVNKHNEPNSQRTLVPEYLPENRSKNFTRSNSVKNFNHNANIQPGNFSSLIYKTNPETSIVRNRKATDPRVYKSFSFNEENNINSGNNVKRNLK